MKDHFAKIFKYFGIYILTMGISTWASAGVVFSNFGPNFSYDTNNGNVVGDGFDGSFYSQGGSFTPGENAVFGSLEIALSEVYPGSQQNPFTINLVGDSGNSPGVVLESWSTGPGSLGLLGNGNAPTVLHSSQHLTLLAGTEYWVTASLAGSGNAVAWNWNSTGDLNAEAINDGSGWFSPSGLTPGAFQVDSVESTVAEPSTLALFSIAFAGVAFRSRHKHRQAEPR